MIPMRPHHTLCIVVTLALGGDVSATLAAQTPAPGRNIDSLLARMTLEEKLGQLNQLSVDNQPTPEQLELVRKGLVGSFLNLTGAAATRLNSSHSQISYAVFCLKKKKMTRQQ